jgi:hypothetical protein
MNGSREGRRGGDESDARCDQLSCHHLLLSCVRLPMHLAMLLSNYARVPMEDGAALINPYRKNFPLDRTQPSQPDARSRRSSAAGS